LEINKNKVTNDELLVIIPDKFQVGYDAYYHGDPRPTDKSGQFGFDAAKLEDEQ